MSLTYLTTDQLAKRIQYHPRTIRHELIDSLLICIQNCTTLPPNLH